MKIMHITPSIGPESYGLGQVVLNLARAQRQQGLDSTIWCLDSKGIVDDMARQYGLPRSSFFNFRSSGPRSLPLSFALICEGLRIGSQYDIIHQHGIWTGLSIATILISRKHGCKTVIAPHGSLEKWALKKFKAMKKVVSMLYERRNLETAACMYATANTEVVDFLNYGLKNSVALINNGVSDVWLDSCGNRNDFCCKYKIPKKKRILLFMSRITPKKGLPILIDAWATVVTHHDDWNLVIIGRDEFGHKTEVVDKIKKNGLDESIHLVDPVFGKDKRDAFASADLFILPSYSEGFPMVVLDCLGAGVPAVVTRASAWKDLETYKCGWWVDSSVDSIRIALEEAMSLPRKRLIAMGVSGKELVRRDYNWSAVVKKTTHLYNWLIGSGSKPNFIINPQEVSR